MTSMTSGPVWATIAILVARLVYVALFLMAASFKFTDINGTAGYIAAAGFPLSLALAWLAAIFEVALIIGFLTGAFFTEASLLAAAYVVFLGFAFHGPSHWDGGANQMEVGAFISHFPFAAGLLFAAVHGPGRILALRHGIIRRSADA